MSTQTTNAHGWALKLALLFVALAVGVAMVEVSLRLAGVAYPRVTQRHDVRGTAYRPHVEWVQSAEGYAHVRTNSDGFRDDEWIVAKPPDTLRVAVLGDSYVDALQVEETDRFTERLEPQLAQCGAASAGPVKSIEVMNFGQSGYGTAQELLTFRHNVTPYSPDLVVLAFLPHNDLRNNSSALQRDPGRPYFTLGEHGLVFDGSFRDSPFHDHAWWKRLANLGSDYSRILQLAKNARRSLQRRSESRDRRQTSQQMERSELGLDDMSYLEPTDPVWQEAWRTTEAIILAMKDEVHHTGAGFMVVTLSAGTQVHPDPATRRQFAKTLGVKELFYADRRIARLGTEGDFPVVNLAPGLQEFAEAENIHLHGFDRPGSGHWNEVGHRVAAQLVADDVCRNWDRLIK